MKKFLLTLILTLIPWPATAQGLTLLLKGEPTFGVIPPIWLSLRFADVSLPPSSIYPATLPASVLLDNTWDNASLEGQVEFDLVLPGLEFRDEPLVGSDCYRIVSTRDTVIGTGYGGDSFHLVGCAESLMPLGFITAQHLTVNVQWPSITYNDPMLGYPLGELDRIPFVPTLQQPTGQFVSTIQLSSFGFNDTIRWEASEVRVYIPEPSMSAGLLCGILLIGWTARHRVTRQQDSDSRRVVVKESTGCLRQ